MHHRIPRTGARRTQPSRREGHATTHVGAEGTFGQKIYDQVVNYATNVTGDIAPTGHWVAEEDPAYLTARLLDFLSDDHASPDARHAMATA